MNQRFAIGLMSLMLSSMVATVDIAEARGDFHGSGGGGGDGGRPAGGGGGGGGRPSGGGFDQARAAQEQAVRAQEEQARQTQQQAFRQQQQEARQWQQPPRQQESRQPERQPQERQPQERQPQERQPQERMAQQQPRQQQARMPQQERQSRVEQGRANQSVATQTFERGGQPGNQQRGGNRENQMTTSRPVQPRQLNSRSVPLQKAISMPVLEQNVSSAERQHAQSVNQNLQRHLTAVAPQQIPSNFSQIRSRSYGNYTNNFAVDLDNHRLIINRQNTHYDVVPQYEYPYWWHSSPGWSFSNGFTLGSAMNVGLDWLRWGWHPYYGPLPDGFVCATDYVPTPWIYFPAYGLWREPGLMGWAPAGPSFNYTGPISVEILEPRHVSVRDPYTGFVSTRVVNVPYFYNAFFHPDYDRWGYINRHGYLVWLNI